MEGLERYTAILRKAGEVKHRQGHDVAQRDLRSPPKSYSPYLRAPSHRAEVESARSAAIRLRQL